MERDLEKELLSWKDDEDRLPLMIRGARQVGKSYLVQQFGKKHFEHFIEINFEYDPGATLYFETLDPEKILNTIRLTLGATIIPGKTLLFLDEIQLCKQAILALRYFYEKMPQLHVIAAGSLLEFTLTEEDLRIPVGRIQYLFMKPLSFSEYLTVNGLNDLRNHLDKASIDTPIELPIHNRLLELVREYMVIGGMPKVISDYLKHRDMSRVERLQSAILMTYQDDFGKYATKTQYKYLQLLFSRAPRIVSKEFEYKDVSPEIRSREIKSALDKLKKAGLLHVSHAVSASGLPLGALIKEKKFKIFFLDVGQLLRSVGLSSELLLGEDLILVHRGAIAEQFVAQELVAYSNRYESPELFWWHREKTGSTAEVDFVISSGKEIVPIEVKSGAIGRLRSLKIFMEKKQSKLGIRISQANLSLENRILSVPFYLVHKLQDFASVNLSKK